jgi:hypothetical protein
MDRLRHLGASRRNSLQTKSISTSSLQRLTTQRGYCENRRFAPTPLNIQIAPTNVWVIVGFY